MSKVYILQKDGTPIAVFSTLQGAFNQLDELITDNLPSYTTVSREINVWGFYAGNYKSKQISVHAYQIIRFHLNKTTYKLKNKTNGNKQKSKRKG
jgi:hypothetical protein